MAIAAMVIGIPAIPTVTCAEPVTFYQSFAGNIDFQMTGASLRRRPNWWNACSLVSSRSANLVNIPAGSTILSAYLYWAGSGATVDNQVVFQGTTVTATRTFTENFNFGGTNYPFFSGFADVTAMVPGNGTYTLSGLSVNNGSPHCPVQAVVSGWSLIVIYENTAEPLRVINLYDGFQFFRASAITLTPSNFQVPPAGCDDSGECKWGVLTWEGDAENSSSLNGFSENLFVNGVQMTTAVNPANNQFNSTIDLLGTWPNPPGTATYGIDVDIYSPLPIPPGATSANTIYQSGQDLVLLSAEVFSVQNMPVADLAIVKSHTGDFTVGLQETYTLQVTNNGPNDATGIITVTDTLPTGLSYVSGTGTGWSCGAAGQTVTCTHPGPLANGGNLPDITLTVDVGAAAVPSVTNTAAVSCPTFDNQAWNDSDSDVTVVVQPALSITKSVSTISNPVENMSNPKAIPGAILEYEIVVTNIGSSDIDADSVLITDPLAANLRLVLNTPVSPVVFDPGTSTLSLTPTDVGNNPTPPYNDVALSNDGGSTYLTLGQIAVSGAGIDATSPRIDFIRINPKGTFPGASGSTTPTFTIRFRVQLQ
jgi:uncharacterized repeat protein (TIGR01451 family)